MRSCNCFTPGKFLLSAAAILVPQSAGASNPSQRAALFDPGLYKSPPGLQLAQAAPSATIKYDQAGRITTTLYTDQTCVVNKYNAQGNRTDVAVTKASTPESNVWGTGVWGCAPWQP